MHGCGYLSGQISVSRFNRRLHALADWLVFIPPTLGELFTTGEVFVIDSIPLPVCRRVRARRCRKVRGREYCGYCAAKRERFFGWRLHLICRPDGVPVRFQLLPAGFHDLTPVHEVVYGLPSGARLLGDKGSADCQYRLKTAESREIVRAVRATASGQSLIDPAVAPRLIARLRQPTPTGDTLTERELDVVRHAARGLTNKQIGAELQISDRTVQNHLANIYTKLEVASRTEAVTAALQRQLIKLNVSARKHGTDSC